MSKEIVKRYIEAINNQDLEKIAGLMTNDHEFVDAEGGRYTGKENILEGWPAYFEMFPDYEIEITDILEENALVGVFGYASGTYKNLQNENNSNHWRLTASWKALVEDKKIKYWQVYCDYTPIHEIIRNNRDL
ncbi:hypothetical protein ES703_29347 [subsurface metagenome]